MLQKVLLIISVSSLSACAILSPSAPKAPSVELGVIDYTAGQVIVNKTGSRSFQNIDSIEAANYRSVVKAISEGGNRVPLSTYNRAIAFKPVYWTAVQNYMNELTTFIRNHCSGE